LTLEENVAVFRGIKTRNTIEECGFAGSVWPDDRINRSFGDLEVYGIYGG
jgi:hypothetical protein